jgi:PAS domain S-box-containing protein
MAPNNGPQNRNDEPIYNSRIMKGYLQYVSKHFPDINIDSVLEYAGMTRYAVEDQGHWFTQIQADRFYEILVKEIGNPNIAREVGRYSVSVEALGVAKQYTIGLLRLTSIYLLMQKLYPILSRGATIQVRKLGSNKVEITSTPKTGIDEKPYQCENRMGTFESLGMLFSQVYSNVEHPSCFHKGDDCCRYIITWEESSSFKWRRVRNYSFIVSILATIGLFFALPVMSWLVSILIFAYITMTLSIFAFHLEKEELTKTIETQGDSAKNLLDEMNIRYNNALLVQEIGQATSTIFDIRKLINNVVQVMEKHLDFDRGMIMLSNRAKTRLIYAAGYGYYSEQEELLKGTEFHLDNPESKGVLVLSFKEQKPYLINDINEIEKNLSARSKEFVHKMGIESLISVPIVYEKISLGLLAVDNKQSKRAFTQSDLNLLMGVASQTAVGIINATAFQKLRTSEKKYRDLVENANSIILRMDTSGKITFFNEFAQNLFGYEEIEILGKNVEETIFASSESSGFDLKTLVESLRRDPEQHGVSESENRRRNGEPVWIAWTYKPIINQDSTLNFREILCIGTNLTDLRRAAKENKELEAQLQSSQRMESIGTLAGGIAHDFNNILQAIFGYTQIMLMTKDAEDPEYGKLQAIESSAQKASELTKRLLLFSRKAESVLKPVDLGQEVVQVSEMLKRTIPKMISIELQLDEKLNVINADAGQTEQIMMNLGINARDAMPDGGKMVFKTENVTLDEDFCKKNLGSTPGEYVRLTVSDTGQGMDKEIQEHIFEPFYTTKETGKGTGLGLSMVYGIVKNHKGYITCESEPDQGTKFSIYFPVIDQEVETQDFLEESIPIQQGNETILLVDDEQTHRDLGKEVLTGFGYKVVTVPDGEGALEFFRKDKKWADLVILDLIMPGMGGMRCLKELLKENPLTKVLVASGYSIKGSANDVIEAGAKAYISKPYNVKKMFKVVREILDGD